MSRATWFLGRLIGLYCLVVSLSMILHRSATIQTVTELVHSPPLLFLVGIIGMAVGLAMIVAHNVWSGGALPVTVTLIGWLALIKGGLMLFLSREQAPAFFLAGLRYERFYYVYAAATFLLGAYLTYGTARRSRNALGPT